MIKAPRFGLKVHRSPLAPKPVEPIAAADFATAEDYEVARPDPVGPRSAADWRRGGH